jgi:hypothetical protein
MPIEIPPGIRSNDKTGHAIFDFLNGSSFLTRQKLFLTLLKKFDTDGYFRAILTIGHLSVSNTCVFHARVMCQSSKCPNGEGPGQKNKTHGERDLAENQRDLRLSASACNVSGICGKVGNSLRNLRSMCQKVTRDSESGSAAPSALEFLFMTPNCLFADKSAYLS